MSHAVLEPWRPLAGAALSHRDYGPPDLLVEVLSSRPSLDAEVKMEAYARAQVPHYWIVDPERYTVRAYELDYVRWTMVTERRDDDAFEPALFPGLVIPLV